MIDQSDFWIYFQSSFPLLCLFISITTYADRAKKGIEARNGALFLMGISTIAFIIEFVL